METAARPVWSANEAARRAGVSRSTIQRMIGDGRLAATKDDDGVYRVELADLLAAGLRVDRPTPPDTPAPVVAQEPAPADDGPAHQVAREVAELRVEVARWQERARAAEQVAAERDRVIEAQAAACGLTPGRQKCPRARGAGT